MSNMSNTYKAATAADLSAYIAALSPRMPRDPRPYKTLLRLGRNNGHEVVITDGQLRFLRRGEVREVCTFSDLLRRGRQWVAKEQKNARSAFAFECADEDLCEIELLQESWSSCRPRQTAMPSNPSNENVNERSMRFIPTSDEVDLLFASF